MTKKRKEQIIKLCSSSNLEDIKLGCILIGRANRTTVQRMFDNGDWDIMHNCTDVPHYLPEHRLWKKPEPAMSLVIYTRSVGLCNSSSEDKIGEPGEFF